jgi:hypothetical protein
MIASQEADREAGRESTSRLTKALTKGRVGLLGQTGCNIRYWKGGYRWAR